MSCSHIEGEKVVGNQNVVGMAIDDVVVCMVCDVRMVVGTCSSRTANDDSRMGRTNNR